MRVTAIMLAAAIFAAPAFAEKKEKTGPVYEPNTYRFGGTYSVTSSLSPSQCSSTCGRDSRCLAWSFVNTPGAANKNACELKSTVGKSESNPTATSGISERIEKNYQPSPYQRASTLLGASTQSSTTTTRRTVSSHNRTQTTAPVVRSTTTSRRATLTPAAPKRMPARSAQATVSTGVTKRVITPAAPASIAAPQQARVVAPAAQATISTSVSKPVTSASIPASTKPQSRTMPIAVNSPAKPVLKSATPQVQFQPLKRSSDGTYKPTTTTAAATPAKKSRVVLTGPKGSEVSKSVNGRVVLTGEMAGDAGGGVGETPAAPIPRNAPVNAQGERVPYKDLSSREYPDYSVTQAAEDGQVEGIAGEAGS